MSSDVCSLTFNKDGLQTNACDSLFSLAIHSSIYLMQLLLKMCTVILDQLMVFYNCAAHKQATKNPLSYKQNNYCAPVTLRITLIDLFYEYN